MKDCNNVLGGGGFGQFSGGRYKISPRALTEPGLALLINSASQMVDGFLYLPKST